MGGWRYIASLVEHEESGESDWGIREFYPSDSGRFSYTADPVRPSGSSYEELIRDLEHMRQDCSLEILDLRGDEPKLVAVEQTLDGLQSDDGFVPLAAEWEVPPALRGSTDTPPQIVCICGSTRFRDEIADADRKLTLGGAIVVAPAVFQHRVDPVSDEQKRLLDELHLRKIDLADAVFVVDPGGYIGTSTRREIEYAHSIGTPVFRLSATAGG